MAGKAGQTLSTRRADLLEVLVIDLMLEGQPLRRTATALDSHCAGRPLRRTASTLY